MGLVYIWQWAKIEGDYMLNILYPYYAILSLSKAHYIG